MSQQSHPSQLSRRRFLTASALTLGVTAAAPLLQACQQATPTVTPEQPAAKTTAPTPTSGQPAAATPTAAPAAAKPTTAPAKPAGEAAAVSDFGATYPADAAPKDKQYTARLSN